MRIFFTFLIVVAIIAVALASSKESGEKKKNKKKGKTTVILAAPKKPVTVQHIHHGVPSYNPNYKYYDNNRIAYDSGVPARYRPYDSAYDYDKLRNYDLPTGAVRPITNHDVPLYYPNEVYDKPSTLYKDTAY